ncbi:MAG: DUF3016 domain-containing protein [Massilia sp.]
MLKSLRLSAAATLAMVFAGQAFAGATVTYVAPDHFADVPFSSVERDHLLQDLSRHFDKLAAKLPAGQQLNVEVTDVDLAGQTWPARSAGRDIRVLNGRADWPHLTMHYTVTQDGQTLKSGTETITDMNYQMHRNRYDEGDSLRYEKRMLDTWFQERLASR